MLKKILGFTASAILVLLVVVFFLPSDFKITRSIKIKAPPFIVFSKVNDFRHWEHWSPWAKIDPSMKITLEGSENGEGAVYHWTGNQQVGEGRMTIIESKSNEQVVIQLEFIKPFESKSIAEFEFKIDGELTEVFWSMSGNRNYLEKLLNLILNFEKLLSADFDKGLQSLKEISEAEKFGH